MGTYITQSDIEAEFGVTNVAIWSNLDNESEEADASRINAAIAKAEARVESFFRGGKYLVPFAFLNESGSVIVKEWCAKLAGIWLYEGRGTYANGEEETNRYLGMKRAVMSDMTKYANGAYTLDAHRLSSGVPTAPAVV